VRVVDHDATGDTAGGTERIRQEHLAIESLERGIDLKKQYA
jgi:hypothetical protein